MAGNRRLKNVYQADFETTTNPEDCRVWLWGLYDLNKDKFQHGDTIETFFENMYNLDNNSTVYFHNLKFDGEFVLYYLFRYGFTHTIERNLENMQFKTLITYMGVFYAITLKCNDKEFTIYDSLKILPLPVKKISSAFGITQLKGEIDYKMERKLGYKPTEHEIEYVKNDVEIVGKSLLYFFNQKLDKMTQASNAFHDYKNILTKKIFDTAFPPLESLDADLRESYKGGFTYVNPVFQNRLVKEGIVLDVNSLYPSVMYYCKLPYGEPILYEGKYVEDKIYSVYIQMFRCNFELKKNHIPTLQLKHNPHFGNTEYVTSSNGHDVPLCLTSVDLELFLEHYDVYNMEYFKGWKFKATNTLFKSYIDKWTKIKEQATIDGNEGLRTIAKLMLNALYGKFGLNPHIKAKIPTFDGEYVKYVLGEDEERKTIYIPVASFVTSYARKITIESAQKNFERFMYADTDSLHLSGLDLPTELNIDNVKLGCWKFEGKFNKAKYLRAKSYIENMYLVTEEWEKLNEEKRKKWKHNKKLNVYEQINVVCAGLPKDCQDKVNFNNFKNGLTIFGKLQHKRVKGGVVLKEIDITIEL